MLQSPYINSASILVDGAYYGCDEKDYLNNSDIDLSPVNDFY